MSNKPRRDRQQRDREIKKLKRERGISHTAALRILDAQRGVAEDALPAWVPPKSLWVHDDWSPQGTPFTPPAGVAPVADPYGHAYEMSAAAYLLTFTVPAQEDVLGSEVSKTEDAIVRAHRFLVRADAGWYRAGASVYGPLPVTMPVTSEATPPSGHVTVTMLVAPFARIAPTLEALKGFMQDSFTAAAAAILQRHPAPAPGLEPEQMPVDPDMADQIRERLEPRTTSWMHLHPTLAAEGPAYETYPERVVDIRARGWRHTGKGRYTVDLAGQRGLDARTYDELAAIDGPLSVVRPPGEPDAEQFVEALAAAGTKAAATLLVALYQLAAHYRQWSQEANEPTCSLVAGAEEAEDSAAMMDLVWSPGERLAEQPDRFDAEALTALKEEVEYWTGTAHHYTEVAGNLAVLFSRTADAHGGWGALTDPELRSMDRLRDWLMSQAETPQAAPASEEERPEVRRVPFVFAATVPGDADRVELAQVLADHLHTLHRKETGERYEGRADVIVPRRPWAPEPNHPTHVQAVLLITAWAMRPWNHTGEWEAVISDFYAAAKTWVRDRYPVPVGGQPAAMPVSEDQARALTADAVFTAHTGGEHTHLPAAWVEQIEAQTSRATVTDLDGQGDLTTWTSAEPPGEPLARPGMGIVLGPNVAGGLEKTTVAAAPVLPPHQVIDVDSEPPPYRVVDRDFQGWYRRSGDGRYDADRGHARGLGTMSYEDLAAARGPLRPVEPPTAEESAAVKAALTSAGRKAAVTVLVALYRLVLKDAQAAGRQGGPRNRLMAGREGSWESEAMVRLAWNLGSDLDEKPKRYDESAVGELVRVVEEWVSAPHRYTEVAANLASAFSAVADEAGSWKAVADQYLQRHQRVGLSDQAVEAVQNYLMSQSSSLWE
ncbi:hypothetical protein ABT039_22290 [Streptomyces lasiicapitis]|uniref:hypothetical protein n=1 Tax=Streptomyces lasiicapitis TaxID=1923961 RepID=UPI00331BCC0B